MSNGPIHLITIVAESVLEERLVRDVMASGGSGWTAQRICFVYKICSCAILFNLEIFCKKLIIS